MKSSIAAMVVACEEFIQEFPQHKGSIGFLITSDEEGPARDGTVKVVQTLQARNETMDWCLIGEPSCHEQFGDVIKNGRRGSLNGSLRIHGTQGHIAYPHLAANPIHLASPALAELIAIQWDHGNDFFPPTSFQISNIHSGTGADNVIPAYIDVSFNFRFSTEQTAEKLQEKVNAVLSKHALTFDLQWYLSGLPFLTSKGELIDATVAAIKSVIGMDTVLSTAGGTSDGRFIAPLGVQVIELGLLNKTIHKVNECVSVTDLENLKRIYKAVLVNLLAS
jgi:succinyl-diaminopimelate desuccinylase